MDVSAIETRKLIIRVSSFIIGSQLYKILFKFNYNFADFLYLRITLLSEVTFIDNWVENSCYNM